MILAYLGVLFFVAVYYLLFEVNPPMTRLWHDAVPNSSFRHTVRFVGEGLFGGLFAKFGTWNHYKQPVRSHIRWWEIPLLPVLVLIFAVPGFTLGWLLTLGFRHNTLHIATAAHNGFHALGVHLATHPRASNLTDKLSATVTANWDKRLIGLLAAQLFGRRPTYPTLDFIQLQLAERHVASEGISQTRLGRLLYRLSPPQYQARCHELEHSTSERETIRHPHAWRAFTLLSILIALGMAAYGEYILTVISKSSGT